MTNVNVEVGEVGGSEIIVGGGDLGDAGFVVSGEEVDGRRRRRRGGVEVDRKLEGGGRRSGVHGGGGGVENGVKEDEN